MRTENKELLLRDLCARLPYGVKVGTTDNDGSLENVWDTLWFNTFTEDVKLTHSIEDADKIIDISETKPYLFPLSSMTEEQFLELTELCNMYDNYHDYNPYEYWGIQVCRKHIHGNKPCFSNNYKAIDWFNKNHFDYRGLIPKGLAIDATNLDIY